METSSSSLSSLVLPPPRGFAGDLLGRRRDYYKGVKKPFTKILMSKRDEEYGPNYDGKFVDENMIVLRMRIHEMKMAERNCEPPLHWMEWEKRYSSKYDSDVCEAVGLLQSKLMETRPGLALGTLALVLLSVSTSMLQIIFHLVSMIKGFS